MNKLTKYLYAGLLAGTFFACNNTPEWHVDGRIDGADGQTMYVEANDNGRWYILDSVKLTEAGDFKFTSKASGYPDIYRLRLDNKTLYFPIDSIETVTVMSKASAFDQDYTLAGSSTAEKLMEVDRKVLAAAEKLGFKNIMTDSVLKRELSNMLLENPSDIVAYYIINKKLGGTPIFSPSDKNDLRIIGAVANAYDMNRPLDPRTNYLKKLFISNRKTTSSVKRDTLHATELTMIDVNLFDNKGVKHSLEKVASEKPVVLLSFTAYSSDFSPALNIELNKAYTKYHSQGLEIYQIGFDENEYEWRETARNLPWITVYNSSTDGPEVIQSYNVGQLPALFILKNGEIRERVTDATRIQQAVAKYM